MYTTKFIFQIKCKVVLIGSEALSCGIVKLKKYSVVLELHAKMCEEMAKAGFTRNAITSKPNKIFYSKFHTTILEPVTKLCQKFKVLSIEMIEN